MSGLKLAIPSKGRLQQDTINWFATLGIDVRPAEGGREYAGRVDGIQDVELVLLSAGEIPRALATGQIHLGLTGRDLVHEKLPGWRDQVEPLATPGFGFADLVLAVPQFWLDVSTIDDLDAAAAAFRARHGMRLRIATKYHHIVRSFLRDNDVADYQLVDSQGATEGTIRNLTAEAIADITTSGATLVANHLKILTDGLILKSEAVLYLSAVAHLSEQGRAALQELRTRLKSV